MPQHSSTPKLSLMPAPALASGSASDYTGELGSSNLVGRLTGEISTGQRLSVSNSWPSIFYAPAPLTSISSFTAITKASSKGGEMATAAIRESMRFSNIYKMPWNHHSAASIQSTSLAVATPPTIPHAASSHSNIFSCHPSSFLSTSFLTSQSMTLTTLHSVTTSQPTTSAPHAQTLTENVMQPKPFGSISTLILPSSSTRMSNPANAGLMQFDNPLPMRMKSLAMLRPYPQDLMPIPSLL